MVFEDIRMSHVSNTLVYERLAIVSNGTAVFCFQSAEILISERHSFFKAGINDVWLVWVVVLCL